MYSPFLNSTLLKSRRLVYNKKKWGDGMQTYTLVVKQDTISKEVALDIKRKLKGILQYDNAQPDLVISVGGDGTVL